MMANCREWDAARLEVFNNLLSGVAEEMGVVLGRSGHSPNIKERRDFSCALCDSRGDLVAQAAHIPVHLGALPASMRDLMRWLDERGEVMGEGDVIIWNDPFHGGTHLPDITMASPVRCGEEIIAYVVNRAHHSDVGGMSPGSMPLAEEVFQEGLVIPMLYFARGGRVVEDVEELLLANVRTPRERRGDLRAQMGALRVGERRLAEIAGERGKEETLRYMGNLLDYGEAVSAEALGAVPPGEYAFRDVMDDDGRGAEDIPIQVRVSMWESRMRVDFAGTSGEVEGPLNCPRSVTLSAVYYVFRCLLPRDAPFNQGCLRRVEVLTPRPSLLDATWPRAVAGGNVETSQRVVDVMLGALHQALPDRIPAASYGTMTNVAIGGRQPAPFAYYETVAGGCGARPGMDGLDATHNHMTNTMNTPVEALEYAYPLRVLEYAVARGTGGEGRFRGGDGVLRRIEVLERATLTLLADRRKRGPYGLAGGKDGRPGEDYVVWLVGDGGGGSASGGVEGRADSGDLEGLATLEAPEAGESGLSRGFKEAGSSGEARRVRERLPSKVELKLEPGDILEIRTPGGGAHG